MRYIDINCDLGELDDGSDLQIMPYISSCNIACGGHAGNPDLMLKAIQEANRYLVTIGAHPGYADRTHFGRKSVSLENMEITLLIYDQVTRLQNIAVTERASIRYVKLHGALYHDAAEHQEIARAVVEGVKKTGLGLAVLGPVHSALERETLTAGLKFFMESFIDRRYNRNGRLVPRTAPDAVIGDRESIEKQLREIALERKVSTIDGAQIDLEADSICIHGDHAGALENAQAIRKLLSGEGITVKSFLT
ncbi:MAG: 5-oxoprolinase subunit PxpA [Cyclobacteriaceae bacterium]